nr:cell division control protein 48 homolog C-like [Tanacetum cinerariifolium]
MIVESIENGPYVRRMIAAPGEPDLPDPVPESFHEQTDEELTENDIKWMDADDQALQTILLGLPEDVYAAVDSCEIAKEIWERVRQMMIGSDIEEQEKKAKIFNEWEKFTINKLRMLEKMVGISLDSMLDKWHRIRKGIMHGRMVEIGGLDKVSIYSRLEKRSQEYLKKNQTMTSPSYTYRIASTVHTNVTRTKIVDARKVGVSIENIDTKGNEEEWKKLAWSREEMAKLGITMSNIEVAAKLVQPSTIREGFSSIPNVKWEDFGGLDSPRRELV